MAPTPATNPTAPTTPSLADRIVYGPLGLALYETVVAASCAAIWRCPRTVLLKRLYQQPHLGPRHLSIGVGSGALLTKAVTTTPRPHTLHLLDLHPGPLNRTAARLADHTPAVHTHTADVLRPLPVPADSVDSADLTLMLHCVRGDSITAKAAAIDNVARALVPGGTVVGATVLARGLPRTPAARALMGLYNRTGVFSNHGDSLTDLETELRARFDRVEVEPAGCVALFSGVARG